LATRRKDASNCLSFCTPVGLPDLPGTNTITRNTYRFVLISKPYSEMITIILLIP
jgi:hypothetical protein